MSKMGELFQDADWQSEKHVPVIECPAAVPAGEIFKVRVTLGNEEAHPNTTAHHIRWIQLFFRPKGEKTTYQIANYELTAHGESVYGADKGPIYTNHSVVAEMKTNKSGTLHAASFCNVHGLWENFLEITVA